MAIGLLGLVLFLSVAVASPRKTNEEIRIGMLLSLTGEFSFFGAQAKNGAEIAAEELRSSGVNVKLFYQDDACLPKNAVDGYQKLVVTDRVNAVVGPGCTGGILAIGPIAKRERMPVLALLDANKQVEGLGDVAALGFSSEREAEVIGEELRRRNLHRVAMLCETDAWAELVCRTFRELWNKQDEQLVADELQNVSDRDYRPLIQRCLARRPEAFYFVPAFNGGVFIKQFRMLNSSTPVFGPDTFGIKEVLDIAGKAAEHVVYASVDFKPETQRQKHFLTAYTKEFGEAPSSFYYAALAYDAVQVMASIVSNQVSWPDGLRNSDWSAQTLEAVKFDERLMARIEPVLMTIRDGRFERLSK